jgi:hypothetical protein
MRQLRAQYAGCGCAVSLSTPKIAGYGLRKASHARMPHGRHANEKFLPKPSEFRYFGVVKLSFAAGRLQRRQGEGARAIAAPSLTVH